jgi:hypothetical protein
MKLKSYYVFLIAFIVVAAYTPISFMLHALKYDVLDISLPWRFFIVECIHSGILPLWNPFTNFGFPQMAEPQTWYPVSWIFSLFGRYTINSLHLEWVLHAVIGAWGMFSLVKINSHRIETAFILALCYSLSGFYIGHAEHIGWIISAAWLPWVFYSFLVFIRKYNLYYGLWMAVFLFFISGGGYPAFLIISIYVLIVWFAIHLFKIRHTIHIHKKKIFTSVAILIGVYLLLVSGIIAFGIDLSSFIIRGKGLSLEETLIGSFSLQSLMSLMFPLALTSHYTYWNLEAYDLGNIYMGLIVLLGILLGVSYKKTLNFSLQYLAIAMLFLLFSMGDDFPVRAWLYHYVPLMDFFRLPALFRLFSIVFFILSAAYGIDRIWDQKNTASIRNAIIALLVISLTIAVFWFDKSAFSVFLNTSIFDYYEASSIAQKISFQASIQLVLLLTLIAINHRNSPKRNLLFSLVFILDIILAANLNMPKTVYQKDSPAELYKAMIALPSGFPLPDYTSALSNFNDDNTTHLPLLWKNPNTYHKQVAGDGHGPYKSTWLENVNENFPGIYQKPILFIENINGKNSTNKSIDLVYFTPNQITFNVKLESEAMLYYTQWNYPGWKAYKNDTELDFVPNKANFLAVQLPKGLHTVKMEFKPLGNLFFFYLSAIAFITCILYLIYLLLFKTKQIQ